MNRRFSRSSYVCLEQCPSFVSASQLQFSLFLPSPYDSKSAVVMRQFYLSHLLFEISGSYGGDCDNIGTLRRVVAWKLTDVSEVITALRPFDGGSKLTWNIRKLPRDYKVWYPSRLSSSLAWYLMFQCFTSTPCSLLSNVRVNCCKFGCCTGKCTCSKRYGRGVLA
jgi:hypothetical protein